MRATLGSELRAVVFESPSDTGASFGSPSTLPVEEINNWLAGEGDTFEVLAFTTGEWVGGKKYLLFLIRRLSWNAILAKQGLAPISVEEPDEESGAAAPWWGQPLTTAPVGGATAAGGVHENRAGEG